MDKIVAINIRDSSEGAFITGYVARTKNRGRVWSFNAKGMTPQEVKAKVEELETARLTPAAAQGGLT